ncbi:MAG: glycosyl transferase family 51, partial [Alphaproteobacteria bacterium]|nr:glycosyl transferase family 51 [Alphaproteobacteria bacterium]
MTRPKTTRPKPPKSAARQRSDKGKYTPYRMRLSHTLWLVPVVILVGFGSIFCYLASEEMRTSKLQSDYFSRLASQVRFELQDGPNPEMRTPSTGPYNQRLGYSYLPFFIKALEADTYTVARQMRASRRYQALVANGIYPPYRPKPVTGLNLFDRAGQSLYSASYPSHVFADFNDIPPLLVNTLLFIENRELLKLGPVTRNPVIEWDRFFYAALGRVLQNVVPGFNAGGGSTLATQIEKFRFSPGGQTSNAWEKIRQIVSASLRVYMDGPDTTRARERIVLDYLNSTPLSARPGFGEVNSIGDGLWVWFGRDLNEASEALTLPESDPDSLRTKALVYREALGLILAQRRPTAYLMTDRKALDQLTDVMLDRLAANSVISTRLATAAKASSFRFLRDPPQPSNMSFIDQKATTALRTHLMTLLSLKNLYELDRLDLSVASTLDQETQRKVTLFLKKMSDPAFLQAIGLYGFRLLNPNNDPDKIKWSVVLYERGDDVNRLRIQADNIDGPFDMNEGVKLDLGSTAKLRTLVTYLEIVGELYRRYAGLADEDLKDLAGEAPDTLTSWGTTWLSENPDATLENMLEAAMDRPYSASPGETFFTGGGAHRFVNFERSDDGRVMPVRQALRNSVNLVFIRIMRDIVNYTIAQGQQTKEELLSDPDQPARLAYLERYADREGSLFLNRYISDYATLSPDETLVKATTHARAGATSRAILFRSLRPKASFAEFSAYMRAAVEPPPDEAKLAKLFKEYPAERYNLSDRSYITKLNPLELWLASYKQENPKASRNAILAVSQPIRLESYAWLFHPNKKGAQD